MTYSKFKLATWSAALISPLLIHICVGLTWAYGGYDGKHCAGLLDAVWECSEVEYYFNYIFNPLVTYFPRILIRTFSQYSRLKMLAIQPTACLE